MTTWTESELAEVDRLSQTLPLNEAWSIVANDKIAALTAATGVGTQMTINNPDFAEVSDRAYTNGYANGYEFGKFEAIEDCAQWLEENDARYYAGRMRRALKDKP